MDTPKSIGQPVGTVASLGKGFFKTDCTDLQNGDGLCFFTKEGNLSGFRIERIENSKIFPNAMKDLSAGIPLYRNHNIALTRTLNKNSSRRRIQVEMDFKHHGDTVHLIARDEDGNYAEIIVDMPYEEPRDLSMARAQIEKQISSTGATPYQIIKIEIYGRIGFFPISFLNSIKRNVLAELTRIRLEQYPRETVTLKPNNIPHPDKQLDYRANVFNERARSFYKRHGAEVVEPAFERLSQITGKEVMRTKYCLLHELDACLKSRRTGRPLKEPLRISDGRHQYLLKFDCDACRMSVIFLSKEV
jgi:putative protease